MLFLPMKEQHDQMVAKGWAGVYKPGITDLTFEDRHKHSGDQV